MTHQASKAQARDGETKGSPDGAVAKVGPLRVPLGTLVEELPGAEADGDAQRQSGLSCRRLPGRPVQQQACSWGKDSTRAGSSFMQMRLFINPAQVLLGTLALTNSFF